MEVEDRAMEDLCASTDAWLARLPPDATLPPHTAELVQRARAASARVRQMHANTSLPSLPQVL